MRLRALLALPIGASMVPSVATMAMAEVPPTVAASYVNGICENQTADCSNYLLGVKEALAWSSGWKACFAAADTSQLRLAFRLYASEHPRELAGPAVQMASEAFRTAFGCAARPVVGKLLYRQGLPIPVPGSPGLFYAQMPDGSVGTMPLPSVGGAPAP